MANSYKYTAGPSMLNLATVAAIVTVSSVVMFTLSSVIFFVVGYICGCKYKQHRMPDVIEATQPIQIYEEIQQHPSVTPTRDQDVELNENIAYGSVQP